MKKFTTRRKIQVLSLALVAMLAILAVFVCFQPAVSSSIEYIYSGDTLYLARGNLTKTKVNSVDSAYQSIDDISTSFGINDAYTQLQFKQANYTPSGQVFRFEQFYNGYKVFGRELTVSCDLDGTVLSVSGNYLKNINIHKPNFVQLSTAVATISNNFNCDVYSASIEVFSLFDVEPLYVFNFATSANGGTRIFANAQNLEKVFDIPLNSYETIPSQTQYKQQTDFFGNIVTLPVEKIIDSDDYYLADATRNIYMYDAQKSTSYSGSPYSNQTGVFDDPAAITIYNNLIKSYDFYADSFGFLGADGSNDTIHDNYEQNDEIAVSALVHYGTDYNNAAYISGLRESNNREALLIFGDGDGQDYTNFGASLDIVGHEYQHIVTGYAAGLIYLNASGALDEAIADMFGALIENKGIANEGFWLCGEDTCLTDRALRNSADPSEFGGPAYLWEKYPFCYDPDCIHWGCDNGGVHYNSTIITHIFYQMYQAMPQYFTEQRIGELLFDTVFRMTPDCTFEQFRLLLVQSATELGFSNKAINTINNAFDNAGIPQVSQGSHTAFFYSNGIEVTIVADYGTEIVIPNDHNPDGKNELVYWNENLYGKRCYPGDKYTMPPHDIGFSPIYLVPAWNNITPTEFAGSGSLTDPFLISSANDLASLAFYVNNRDRLDNDFSDYRYVKLTCDIDLQNIGWIPIGLTEQAAFYGEFDGNGYSVKNISFGEYYPYAGLFGVLHGEVKNLTVDGLTTTFTDWNFHNVGGIVGLHKGVISNCSNTGDILFPTADNVGGIAGLYWQHSFEKIENCINSGNIQGQNAGGIFGKSTSSGYDMGDGLIVPDPAVTSNCINTGNITGKIAGGIAGDAPNTYIINCINTGTISALEKTDPTDPDELTSIGGIVGRQNYKAQAIYHNEYTAQENNAILSCVNTGTINFEHADFYGAIAGILIDHGGTTGKTLYEKNIYKQQSGLSDFGLPVDTNVTGFLGERAYKSTDAMFAGNFDFDNEAYFRDFDRWSLIGGASIFDSVEWKFENNKLPALKKVEYWIDFRASTFAGGNGSEQNPYQIATAEQLALLTYNVVTDTSNTASYSAKYLHYIMTADINLAGKAWTSIGGRLHDADDTHMTTVFYGNFNGNNFALNNLSARSGYVSVIGKVFYGRSALFGQIGFGNTNDKSSTIENIVLTNVNNVSFGSNSISAGIASQAENATINNCQVLSGNIGAIDYAGGIVGQIDSYAVLATLDIQKCFNKATISARHASGMLGYAECLRTMPSSIYINGCVNGGEIVSFGGYAYYNQYSSTSGGIVGNVANNNLTVTNCINTGQLKGFNRLNLLGGIVGKIAVEATNSSCTVLVAGCKEVGGLSNFSLDSNYSAIVGVCSTDLSPILISKCVFNEGRTIATIEGAGKQVVFSSNIESNDQKYYDFSSITFYFKTAHWHDMTPELANALYEMMGNDPYWITLTFVDENGEVILAVKTKFAVAVEPSQIAVPSTQQYEYQISDWSADLSYPTANMTITATLTKSVRSYMVIFKDAYDNTLSTQIVEYGKSALQPNAPQKSSAGAYDFTFEGWSEDFDYVTGNMVITPLYSQSIRTFTVTFVGQDGQVLDVQTVEYGKSATAPDIQSYSDWFYHYEFLGWDNQFSDITQSITVTAQFKKTALSVDQYAWEFWLTLACGGVLVTGGLTIGGFYLVRFLKRRLCKKTMDFHV